MDWMGVHVFVYVKCDKQHKQAIQCSLDAHSLDSWPPLGIQESFLEHIIVRLSSDSTVGGEEPAGRVL